MFCPNCGQERLSTETSFCSRCGFLLSGIEEIVKAGGAFKDEKKKKRLGKLWRNRGFKQGLFIFSLTFVVVPIVTMVAIALRVGPFVPALLMVLLMGGGLLKMLYALMFESPAPVEVSTRPVISGNSASRPELPAQQFTPASSFGPPRAGSWRDTNDLEPGSVTETTTKLLEKGKNA